MAKMCPMDGCKSDEGLCIHDKMMIGMVVLIALVGVVYFGVGLLA